MPVKAANMQSLKVAPADPRKPVLPPFDTKHCCAEAVMAKSAEGSLHKAVLDVNILHLEQNGG